jgi:hypothetical protein
MQEWRSPTGIAVVLVWIYLIAIGAIGCGNDGYVTASLPNNYTLYIWDYGETWIEDPSGDLVGDKHFVVSSCQVHNVLFFGTYSNQTRGAQSTRAYFIIDTARDHYQPFMDKQQWEEVLARFGADGSTLVSLEQFSGQTAGDFARRFAIVIFGFCVAVFGVIAAVLFLYTRAHQRSIQTRL